MSTISYGQNAGSKSDLMIPLYDQESHMTGGSDTMTISASHFWERPCPYRNEHRLFDVIPTMRLVNSVIIIYVLYLGIDFIVGLCTHGMEFMSSVALVFTVIYWVWATWWDEPYSYPVSYTYLKYMGVHPLAIILLLCPFAIVVGWAFFMIGAMFLISFSDVTDVFQWEC